MRATSGSFFAGPELGAAYLLQGRQPTGMIGVRVRVEEDPDVLDVEPELRDALDDQWRRSRIPAVDQDVTLRTGEEERRDVVCANVIEIAGDAEWFRRLLPALIARWFPPPAGDHHCQADGQHPQQDDRAPLDRAP
jgi:hypothetical protein